MKIFVKVKSRAREEKVEKTDDAHYIVYTKNIPEKGKANDGVIRLLSLHFSIPKSNIAILSGQKHLTKVVFIKI